MLPGWAVFKELVKVLETLDACLHGDLIRVHQNVILDEAERHLLRVCLVGVQAYPGHGNRFKSCEEAATGLAFDAFALQVDIIVAVALRLNDIMKRRREGRRECLLKRVKDALVEVFDFTFQFKDLGLEGLNVALGNVLRNVLSRLEGLIILVPTVAGGSIAEGTPRGRNKKDQLSLFLLQLCLSGEDLLLNPHILEDHLHQTNMNDGMFQTACVENSKGPGNTTWEGELEGSLFSCVRALGSLEGMN